MEVGLNALGGDLMTNNVENKSIFDLTGQTAVIIGGTGSIGSEISKSFFHAGANVIIADKTAGTHSKNSHETENYNSKTFIAVDVTDEKSVKSLYEKILILQDNIDILVLASGIQCREPFRECSLETWNKVLNTNLTGSFLICKYLTGPMIANKYGRVIGITSLTADIGIKNISAYCASKGGVSQFLKSVAVELAKYKITVNMIAPGRIETRMTADLVGDQKMNDSIKNRIPMDRFGIPSDLTGAASFLASKASSYMTGQSIIIDGGWLGSGGNLPG